MRGHHQKSVPSMQYFLGDTNVDANISDILDSELGTCDVIISFVTSVHFPKSSSYVSFHTSVDFSVHCSG